MILPKSIWQFSPLLLCNTFSRVCLAVFITVKVFQTFVLYLHRVFIKTSVSINFLPSSNSISHITTVFKRLWVSTFNRRKKRNSVFKVFQHQFCAKTICLNTYDTIILCIHPILKIHTGCTKSKYIISNGCTSKTTHFWPNGFLRG